MIHCHQGIIGVSVEKGFTVTGVLEFCSFSDLNKEISEFFI